MLGSAAVFAAEPNCSLTIVSKTSESVLRLNVEIDGQPLREFAAPRFEKLFAALDRNADGALEEAELKRAPSAGWLRRASWGYWPANHSDAIDFKTSDSDSDGKLSQTEFAAAYQQRGVGSVAVVFARSNVTPLLTAGLLQRLDQDRNGTLDKSELEAAPQRLRALDEDDDGLISAKEIVNAVEQPYPFATHRLAEARIDISEAGVTKTTVPRELTRSSASGVTKVTVPLGAVGSLSAAPQPLELGEHSAVLRTATGSSYRPDGLLTVAQNQFAAVDKNGDATASRTEAAAATNRGLLALFDFADRDANDSVSAEEWNAAVDVLSQLLASNVQLSVLLHEDSLFERFDQDRDGMLNLTEREAIASASIAQKTVLTLIASQGHPSDLSTRLSTAHPAWVRAMDRNQDGYVTRNEFLGPQSQFIAFDRNNDGRLSNEEMARRPE